MIEQINGQTFDPVQQSVVSQPLVKPISQPPIQPVVNNQSNKGMKNNNLKQKIGLVVLMVVLGIGTGYLVSGKSKGTTNTMGGGVVEESNISVGAEFGGKDSSEFKDNAIGVVESGGIDGEGTHKLIREGGPSQTVYMTSSVLSLDQFVGRKVQIWGETFKAQKAGWLMDVGRLKVLE